MPSISKDWSKQLLNSGNSVNHKKFEKLAVTTKAEDHMPCSPAVPVLDKYATEVRACTTKGQIQECF